MRSRLLFVVAVLVAASPFALPRSVDAATPTCFGKPATLVLKKGDPDVASLEPNQVIVGSSGPDHIAIIGINTFVCGNGGDDNIAVIGNGSKIDGGSGNDYLGLIGEGAVAQGGSGSDEMDIGQGATADGGSGDDRIEGGGSADGVPVALFGGSGSDTIYNIEGSPLIDCGAAYDLVYITSATDVRRCEGTAPSPY